MGLVQEQRNKINFHYRTNSVKINYKICQKLKKICFWSISSPFPQFLGQIVFLLENPTLSCTTSYGFLAPCHNCQKKLMMQSHESTWTDRRTGQNLYYRTLPARARSPIKNPKNDTCQKRLKYELKKLINIHIMQARFMKILKISTIKSIKISSKNHTKNTGMQNT